MLSRKSVQVQYVWLILFPKCFPLHPDNHANTDNTYKQEESYKKDNSGLEMYYIKGSRNKKKVGVFFGFFEMFNLSFFKKKFIFL